MKFFALLAFALSCLGFAASVSAQPSLTHASPMALRPGEPTQIRLFGGKLHEKTQWWLSAPAQIETVSAKEAIYKITLDPQTPVGVIGVAAGDEKGVSHPLLLMADDLPSIAEQDKNHQIDQAQPLIPPVAVDGVCQGNVFDYYKISAKAGQWWSAEVVAERWGANMDPVMRLLDADGRELLLADDEEALGADCRFRYQFPRDGDYYLEISENRYQSGARYRLRVGDFPLVSAPYPAGGKKGALTTMRFPGPFSGTPPQREVAIPAQVPNGRFSVSVRSAQGKSSAMAFAAAGDSPEVLEKEFDDPQQATALEPASCVINGCLETPGDRDLFAFTAEKGQKIYFQPTAAALRSPALLTLKVLDAKGATRGERPVSGDSDAAWLFTAAEKGEYRLQVGELLRRGGADYVYRIEMHARGGFRLSQKTDKKPPPAKFLTPQNGGAFRLTLQCSRYGYEGPIELRSTPDGFQWFPRVIPAGAKEQTVIVSPPKSKLGQLRALRLQARAVGEHSATAAVDNLGPLRQRNARLMNPPPWLDGLFLIATAPENPPFFQFAAEKSEVVLPEPGKETTVKIQLRRLQKDFQGGVTIAAESLPPGLSLAVKADKDNYELKFKAADPFQAGQDHSLRIAAFAEHKGLGAVRVQEFQVRLEEKK